jgi:hypothetical protein
MKPNDLRINNLIYLYRKPQDKEMSIGKVRSIYYSPTVYEVYVIQLDDDFVVNIDKGIKPIPITIEFLIENGFVKDINYRFILDEFYHLELMKIGNEFSVFHEKRPNEEFAHHFRRIRYVHEFQNLFYGITGKEFVIKTTSSNAP